MDESRFVGGWLGSALGDALGTTVEFLPRHSFRPLTTITGGGNFGLRPGQFTDDTSMALCLGESLLVCGRFDSLDQLTRYFVWRNGDHMASTLDSFGCGFQVRGALFAFERSGGTLPYCGGPKESRSAGNGALMRLIAIPEFFASNMADAVRFAALSSATTHGSFLSQDACRLQAALTVGALQGLPKERLLDPGYWDSLSLPEDCGGPLCPEVQAIAAGSYQRKNENEISSSGYAIHTLEAALWSFHHSSSFEEGCLLAANLGDDADTVAAVYGGLAGSFYGVDGLPADWRKVLAMRPLLEFYGREMHRRCVCLSSGHDWTGSRRAAVVSLVHREMEKGVKSLRRAYDWETVRGSVENSIEKVGGGLSASETEEVMSVCRGLLEYYHEACCPAP